MAGTHDHAPWESPRKSPAKTSQAPAPGEQTEFVARPANTTERLPARPGNPTERIMPRAGSGTERIAPRPENATERIARPRLGAETPPTAATPEASAGLVRTGGKMQFFLYGTGIGVALAVGVWFVLISAVIQPGYDRAMRDGQANESTAALNAIKDLLRAHYIKNDLKLPGVVSGPIAGAPWLGSVKLEGRHYAASDYVLTLGTGVHFEGTRIEASGTARKSPRVAYVIENLQLGSVRKEEAPPR